MNLGYLFQEHHTYNKVLSLPTLFVQGNVLSSGKRLKLVLVNFTFAKCNDKLYNCIYDNDL
jgi:alkyl hydroperoxide reductase subunit AhpF